MVIRVSALQTMVIRVSALQTRKQAQTYYRHLLFSKMKNVSTNKLIAYHSRNELPFYSKVKHQIGIDSSQTTQLYMLNM